MKISIAIAALLGYTSARHHHQHSLVQLQAPPAEGAETAAEVPDPPSTIEEAKAEVEDAYAKKHPTAEDIKKETEAVLKPKLLDQGASFDATLKESVAEDAETAAGVAKHDALGKFIIADGYAAAAQKKLDDAAKEEAAKAEMVEILKARTAVNLAQEKANNAAAYKAHKAHVQSIKEIYATRDKVAYDEMAAERAEWKGRYGSQHRLPLETPGETWIANMPEHVIEDPVFHIKAPKPIAALLAEAKEKEAAAEEAAKPVVAPMKKIDVEEEVKAAAKSPVVEQAAKEAGEKPAEEKAPAAEAEPAFIQLNRRERFAQKKQQESDSESSSSESESHSSSGSDSGSGSGSSD